MTKSDLITKIKNEFGYPVIKVELNDIHISNSIDEARNKFIKWATGNATQETYFTIMLSGGQSLYDMPIGVTDILNYEFDSLGGGTSINQLFTLDNYLYMNGYYNELLNGYNDGYSLLDYHLSRSFLETLNKYVVNKYNFKYHKYTNQLEIQPPPIVGNILNIPEHIKNGQLIPAQTFDSPGFLLLYTYMIEGSTLPGYTLNNNDFYAEDWIFEYAYYKSMKILGLIRNKFNNYSSLGNSNISLDGSDLIQMAEQHLEKLEENLRNEEVYDGYGIYIG